MHHCPSCASASIRRSHRRSIERLWSWIGLYPFRCLSCEHRFWLRWTDAP
jgi:hypothetical protein